MQQPIDRVRLGTDVSRYDLADVRQGAVDYLKYKSGRERDITRLHPLTDHFLDHRSRLVDLAVACLSRDGYQVDALNARSHIGPAIGSGHLGDILSTYGAIAATAQIDETAKDVRRMTTPVELGDYREATYPIIESDQLPALTNSPEIEMLHITSGGQAVKVNGKTIKLLLSRQLVENDDRGVFDAAFRAFGAQVGRMMGRDYAALLEANANLADGRALFNSTDANALTSGAAPSVTTVDAMMDAMRTRTTADGDFCNARPKYLVVGSGLEGTARILTSAQLAMGDDIDRVHVIVNPWLSGSYYYLIADPAQAPSVALATLEGSDGEPVTMLPSARPGMKKGFDGVAIDAHVAYGLYAVDRNIIRNTNA